MARQKSETTRVEKISFRCPRLLDDFGIRAEGEIRTHVTRWIAM